MDNNPSQRHLGRDASPFGLLTAVVLSWLSIPCPLNAQWELVKGLPLSFGKATPILGDQQIGMIVDAAIRPDGAICVIDFSNTNVLCSDDNGRLLYRVGRKGQGPGEFLMPYRLTSNVTNDLLVFDIGTQQVTTFDKSGTYVGRAQLGVRFMQVGDFIALPSGELAFSGIAPQAGHASDSAVHVFGREGSHIASFAPVPQLKEPRLLVYLGAGPLSISPVGDLLYTRFQPHEVYILDARGARKSIIPIPEGAGKKPEEAYKIEVNAASQTISRTNERVAMPSQAIPLRGGAFVSGHTIFAGRETESMAWVLVDGQEKHRIALPKAILPMDVVGFSPDGQSLWVLHEAEGVPGIWRVAVTWPQ